MIRTAIALLISIFVTLGINSLNAQQQHSYLVPRIGQVDLRQIERDFFPSLNCSEEAPDMEAEKAYMYEQKQRIAGYSYLKQKKGVAAKTSIAADTPIVHRSIAGNDYNYSVPCDNDIAVSNDNWLVSVANTTIFVYQIDEDSVYAYLSLNAFTDTALHVAANQFDPKVLYDPEEDRFIIVYLAGSSSDQTDIIVAFSESNDPSGNWHQYALEGNPFSETTWSDFPMCAITKDEVFITINLIYDDSTWQAGFKESLIWQLNKYDGYAGAGLGSLMHSGISFGGKPIRNLCPAEAGASLNGPNCYFLSDRNFSLENDSFLLVEVTNTIGSAGLSIETKLIIADNSYGMPPDAEQSILKQLATNDARVLSAYLEQDEIHFAGNTIDAASGRAAIFHGILHQPASASADIHLDIIGDTAMDFGYPNLSYSGRHNGDQQCIISFLHTSSDDNPGTSCMFFEKYAGYSERIFLRRADNFVSVLTGTQRWGDYSGSQRKFNEPGKVWVNGFYGGIFPSTPITVRANKTWINELESPGSNAVSIPAAKPENSRVKSFPNPMVESFKLQFDNDRRQWLQIRLLDMQGRLVGLLYADMTTAGKQELSFSTHSLSSGEYLLQIEFADGKIQQEKIVKH